MKTTPPTRPSDSAYLGKVLLTMGECTSAGLSKFSAWMLVGFAAILGALFANLDATTKFLAADTLSRISILFSFAVFFSVLDRYIAAVISSSAEVSKAVEKQPIPKYN